MRRILGLELRRSAAPGILLVLLATGLIMAYVATSRWAPSWMSLAMVQREYLILLWPLALAAGAWQGRREGKSKVGELFAGTPRPAAQRMLPTAGALAIAVVGAYVAMAAAGAPMLVIGNAEYLPAEVFAVAAVGALAMIAAVWIGLAVGRSAPNLWTAPALGVAGLGLILLVPVLAGDRVWYSQILAPSYGMGVYTDYQTIDNRVSAAQAIWLVALAGTGLVLLMTGSWRTRLAALLPVALGLAAAVAVVPRSPDGVRNPIDRVAQELVCSDGTPEVCVSRVHSGLLPEATTLGRRALGLLAKVPGTPTVVHEDTTTYLPLTLPPRNDDVVLMDVRTTGNGRIADERLTLMNMLQGAGARNPACESGGDFEAERAAAWWLLGAEPIPEMKLDTSIFEMDPATDTRILELWRGLEKLPEQEAAARLAELRRGLLACEDVTGVLTRSAS